MIWLRAHVCHCEDMSVVRRRATIFRTGLESRAPPVKIRAEDRTMPSGSRRGVQTDGVLVHTWVD